MTTATTPGAIDALPRVVAVEPNSEASRAGVRLGDEVLSIDGVRPRDILEWQTLVDGDEFVIEVRRDGIQLEVEIDKAPGERLGLEVHSALFDEVRTCDNHCEFCFIYQLPPNLRSSLYLKDDDYRLSFLFGNYTTLTRFTEADFERVVTEGLSPLNVSIHATDPDVRSEMLRNRRGASSLRWLDALLDAGVAVHGQVVVCPGINDGAVLDDTLATIADRYRALETVCVVPLGVSRYSTEARMRPHTTAEAAAVCDAVERWQDVLVALTGRRVVHASDEYYLAAGRPFPLREAYGDVPMYEDGVGMARTFEAEFTGISDDVTGPEEGFFSWVDAAPAEGYRAPRMADGDGWASVAIRPRASAPVGVLSGPLGAAVLRPLIAELGRDDVRVIEVENRFFGGNVGVAGLMVGEDIARTLAEQPEGHRYLVPDVCLNRGVFLDGTSPEDLPRPVEIIPTDGAALRSALDPDSIGGAS